MGANSLRDELASIEAEIEALEVQRRAIFTRSLTAPDEEKIASDLVAEMAAEEPWPSMTWPKSVTGIQWGEAPMFWPPREGRSEWVAIKPCAAEYDGRTYLGIMIGNLALGMFARYDEESGVMSLAPCSHNPAIWIPEKRAVVFGCASWWRTLKRPEDLGQITDADIENVWYVRAFRDLTRGG